MREAGSTAGLQRKSCQFPRLGMEGGRGETRTNCPQDAPNLLMDAHLPVVTTQPSKGRRQSSNTFISFFCLFLGRRGRNCLPCHQPPLLLKGPLTPTGEGAPLPVQVRPGLDGPLTLCPRGSFSHRVLSPPSHWKCMLPTEHPGFSPRTASTCAKPVPNTERSSVITNCPICNPAGL